MKSYTLCKAGDSHRGRRLSFKAHYKKCISGASDRNTGTLGERKRTAGLLMKSSAGRFRNTKEMQAEIFFEALVSGKMDVGEIYRQAERLGLDIVAEVYNIILFTMDTGTESYDIF